MSTRKDSSEASSFATYWRLLQYLRPYLGIFIVSILGFFLYAATQPMLADMMQLFVDGLGGQRINLENWLPSRDGTLGQYLLASDRAHWYDAAKELEVAYLVPVLIVAIYIVRSIGSYFGNYLLARASFSMIHDLRVELFNKHLVLPSSYFDSSDTGRILAKITYNVDQVRAAATRASKIILREGATVIALMAYLLYTNWKLTVLFFVIGPLIGVLVKFASKHFKRYTKKIQASIGDVTHVANEMIGGYQVVKSFGAENYERQRFFDSSDKNKTQNVKLIRMSELYTASLQFIIALAMAGMMFMAMSMLGEYSAGELIAYVTAAAMLPKSIRQLSEVNASIQRGVAAAESVFDVIDLNDEVDLGKYVSSDVLGAIEIKNVDFSYPGQDELVLKDISLSIKPGEMIALVGKSGSGKSTLVSLLPRFYDSVKGSIQLDGVDIKDYTLNSLRSSIALVNQKVTLFNDTVENNVAYGMLRESTADEVEAAMVSAHAKEFIENMENGAKTLVGEGGGRLSGGQRQRLSIARAMLKDAPILILDEATSALDTESEQYIQDALESIMQERTTLVIAHRLSTVEKADRILVMEDGRIVEEGSHESLLQQGGVYKKLYEGQFDE
ncbi:lipid A export permease/ATP-binding protein MsbA [Gammaproteobacteria bacterium 45_16_T64]|nr:lipid A export permease/ATP-binding protein MsbA [Gammaproteobacteria bacterium 45_16_T64]